MKNKNDNRSFVNKPGKVFNKKDDLLYAREKLIYNVTEDILVAMEDSGISKTQLARRMGKQVPSISRLLAGEQNMTLSTLSDICIELGLEAVLNLKPVNVQQASAAVESERTFDDIASSRIEYDVLAKTERFKAPYMFEIEVATDIAAANELQYQRLSGTEV